MLSAGDFKDRLHLRNVGDTLKTGGGVRAPVVVPRHLVAEELAGIAGLPRLTRDTSTTLRSDTVPKSETYLGGRATSTSVEVRPLGDRLGNSQRGQDGEGSESRGHDEEEKTGRRRAC